MVALVDTNVLVYRYDERYPDKQARATALLREGAVERTLVVPHQAVVEVALQGAAEYQLSWYDAHLWAYAEHFGLDTLYS